MATGTTVKPQGEHATGNTSRVREILSWYESDNPGVKTNLARLLNAGRLAGTGKFVILPVDQGFEHGPARSFAVNPAAYDPNYHFELALAAGCNAYAAPLGFIEAAAARHAGEIPLILKMNNHDVLHDEKDPIPAVTAGVADALRLGCVAIGFTIYPGSAHAQTMYEQLRESGGRSESLWVGRGGVVVPTGFKPFQGGRDGAGRGRLRRPHCRGTGRARDQGETAHGTPRAARGQEGLRKS